MTKFEEEVKPIATVEMKVTSDGNEINFHCKTGLSDYLLSKGNADLYLKSQLQQQALPVVPDFIGKLINTFGAPEDGKYINYAASYPENKKELDWIDNHQKTWLTALLVGFIVEKNIVSPCPVCGYENVKSNFCSICGRKNDYE